MIIETTAQLSSEALALAFAKGIRNAQRTWLAKVAAHVMQARPVDSEPWASGMVLTRPFLFRVTLTSNPVDGAFYAVDNRRLHRAVAVIGATDQPAFARIQAGKANRYDCSTLVQLAVFGCERFPA